MSGHNIVTVGVSADGLEALKTIVGNLPSGIAPLLSNLAHDAAGEDRTASSDMEMEVEIATGETNAPGAIEKLGKPSDRAGALHSSSDGLSRDQSRLRPLP